MDTDLFYAVPKHEKSSWGTFETIIVYDKMTKVPLSVYCGGYHKDHPWYWEKRFAADLASGAL